MKTCSKCKEEKDESLFCKCKRSSDGLDYRCKICRKESTNKWRLGNPEKVEEYRRTHPRDKAYMIAKAKRWANENRDKIRDGYKRHREARVAYAREYVKKNKETINKKQKESYNLDKIRHLTYVTKHRLKKSLGIEPPKELVETIVLINQTKQLCKTLKN